MHRTIQILSNYIKDTYKADLGSEENIFNSGIIDSMGFVNLIQFISEKFEISIEPEELIEDNFYSLVRIAEFVLEKKQ